MKYSKEYILKSAFNVFMDKGYDSTSISVLQNSLKMSRGALYRYFNNKEELFTSVIDEYVLKVMSSTLRPNDKIVYADQLIEQIYNRQKLYKAIFIRSGISFHIFLNYTALIIQAAKHYEGFSQRLNKIERRFLAIWKIALRKSKEAGLIKEDTDINTTAQLFYSISLHELSVEYPQKRHMDDNLFIKMTEQNIETRKKMFDYLYSLIKTNDG